MWKKLKHWAVYGDILTDFASVACFQLKMIGWIDWPWLVVAAPILSMWAIRRFGGALAYVLISFLTTELDTKEKP